MESGLSMKCPNGATFLLLPGFMEEKEERESFLMLRMFVNIP